MNLLDFPQSQFLRDVFTAFGIVFAALIVVTVTRAGLRSLARNKNLPLLGKLSVELTPSIFNLVYIIAVKLLLDLLPLPAGAHRMGDHILYVLAVVILLFAVRRGAMVGVEWTAKRSLTSPTLQLGFLPLLRNVVTLFVFLTGGILILKHFDYDVMSLVAALGVGSLAIGLAAKDTLSHMISGFMLIIDRNLTPGDKINLAGTIGEVDEIGLRSTRIRTGDGNMLIVPNAELVNSRILNLSTPGPEVTCSTTIRVPLSVPFEKIRAAGLAAVKEVTRVKAGREPWVNLSSLAEGHQSVSIGFWVNSIDEQGPAASELNQRLLDQMRQEGISLIGPYVAPTTQG